MIHKAILLFCCIPSLAYAAPITVTLDDQQQTALLQLMDNGVKYGGLGVATNAAVLLQLIQQAQADAAKPVPPKVPPDTQVTH